MAWLQLRINTSSEHAESIGDMLTANGSQAVTYVDGEPDGVWTYWDSAGAVLKKQYWKHGEFVRVEDGGNVEK